MRKIDRDVSEYYNKKLQLLEVAITIIHKKNDIYCNYIYMVTRGHN